MKVFQQIERINVLHKLIVQRKTGTPEELAKKLHISSSRLYCILEELKLMGAPISYSRQMCTYYYEYCFEMDISVVFRSLTEHELKMAFGGTSYNAAGVIFRKNNSLLFL